MMALTSVWVPEWSKALLTFAQATSEEKGFVGHSSFVVSCCRCVTDLTYLPLSQFLFPFLAASFAQAICLLTEPFAFFLVYKILCVMHDLFHVMFCPRIISASTWQRFPNTSLGIERIAHPIYASLACQYLSLNSEALPMSDSFRNLRARLGSQ